MIVFEIRNDRVRIRPATGDQFEFAVSGGVEPLRLASPPRWKGNKTPADADFHIYLARAAAQAIARDAGLIREAL